MSGRPEFDTAAWQDAAGHSGATATFPYDRVTVERFRAAFPQARWRDELRAWVVPGPTAERRLRAWLGQELSGVLAYADARGRDAFTFEPIDSPYLQAADELVVRTPYSRDVVAALRLVPWAWWDGAAKAWRVPYRSLEDLRRHWPAIEAAARRSEPEARARRRLEAQGAPEQDAAAAAGRERRRRRYPVPIEAPPPLQNVLMTHRGCLVFTAIDGEIAAPDVVGRFYGQVSAEGVTLVWATSRSPSHAELVATAPGRWQAGAMEHARGWWQATIEELRAARRKAASLERARATRQARDG